MKWHLNLHKKKTSNVRKASGSSIMVIHAQKKKIIKNVHLEKERENYGIN